MRREQFASPYDLSFFDGADLVAVMEVYADASEMGGYLAVGSLLFRKKNIRPFEKKWRAMLIRHRIAYFHMTDCNVAEGPFKGKTDKECDDCAREAIAILLEYATTGAIFAVKESDFKETIGEGGIMPNPFTLCAWCTLQGVSVWAQENDPTARISYVFEAGDDHQKDANTMLVSLAEAPKRAAMFRYRNHAFVPKRLSYPTQAADILAWHGAKHLHRRSEGNYRLRGDFNEIINRLHVTDGNLDRAWLNEMLEMVKRHGGKYGNELAGLAFKARDANFPKVGRAFMELLERDPVTKEAALARAGLPDDPSAAV